MASEITSMYFDISYVWPTACLGWFLVTLVLTGRRWKTLFASIISWLVCLDILAVLDSIVTPVLRHSAHSTMLGFAFLAVPYTMLLAMTILTLRRLRRATSKDHNCSSEPENPGR
jgi:hypothetical protein